MKNKIKSLPIILVFILTGINCVFAQTIVEGFHYADGKPVRILIRDGRISKIERIKKLSDKNNRLIIAPGFIDNQVNGFAGISFSFGGVELTPEGVEKATHELWKNGVTTFLPTLTTNSQELLIGNFTILKNSLSDKKLLGSIPGFHLEGPYINPEDGYRGAHPKQFVRLPDWQEFMELYKASGEKILEVTLAPELEGADDFIKKCTDLGIVVGLGHHNAGKDDIDRAVKNGAKIATHLGNGCANTINRHKNPLWPQLANDDLWISIICDGFHLLPEEIRTFYKVKGTEKTIITSDVTSYASLEPGTYTTQTGETIELTPEGMLRYPAQNVLYGSASAITKGVGNIIKVTGCSLHDAVTMASTNPAKLYNLNDRGILEVGKRADLILFTLDDFKIQIKKTWVNGELVFNASEK
jgi:N-acetylglucosamine-6-phosphate deacetylase